MTEHSPSTSATAGGTAPGFLTGGPGLPFSGAPGMTRRGLLMGSTATAALALAGCGSGSGGSSGSGAELKVWLWSNPGSYQNAFNSVAKTSADLKKISVGKPVTSENDFQVAQNLSLALSAHSTLPDLVNLNYTEVVKFARQGVLMDISKDLAAVSSDLYKGATSITTSDGHAVAFPQSINSKLFFYRADLFDQAGIDASAIETTDDFIEAGKKFHAKFPGRYIMNLNTQPQEYDFNMMLSAYPGTGYANKDGQFQFQTNPAFKQVFTFIREIKTSGIAYPADDFTTDWPVAIKNEKICGFLTASWMSHFLPGYATQAQAGKWKAILWPTLSPLADQRYGSDAGGSIWVVPKGAPNADLAVELLKQARFSSAGSLAWLTATGEPPVLKSMESQVLAAAKKTVSSGESTVLSDVYKFFGEEYLKQQFASYDYVRTLQYDPQAVKEIGILNDWFNKTLATSESIDSIMAGIDHDMSTQIGNPYQ
jgi:multiple sugar transport system substrate-binding protein